jgi:predicted house-cleaning NTP pyrophosphatase (Maf/HAM1 superfamily)
MKKLFVATSSNYKLAILKMVYKSIETISHHSDEHINEQGDPKDESLRIAKDKVLSIDISKIKNDIVIGIDQVPYFNNTFIRKPLTKVKQIEQLTHFSNQLTASHVDTTQVTFRKNSKHSIEKYVEMEDALDCAGGFKIESLGSLVISKVASTDPFALQGVPLLWIVNQLSQFKINPLNSLAEES